MVLISGFAHDVGKNSSIIHPKVLLWQNQTIDGTGVLGEEQLMTKWICKECTKPCNLSVAEKHPWLQMIWQSNGGNNYGICTR